MLTFLFYLNYNNLSIVILQTLQGEFKLTKISNNINVEEFSIFNNPALFFKIFIVSELQQKNELFRLTSSKFLVFVKFSVFVLSFVYFRFIRSKYKHTFLNIILFLTFILNLFLFADFYYWNMLIEIFVLYLIYENSIDINSKKYIMHKNQKIMFSLICVIFLLKILIFNDYRFWELLNIPHLTPSFLDMRLLQGSLISSLNGYDPFIQNPFDPKGRLFAATEYLLFFAKAISLQNENVFIFLITFLILFYISSIFYFALKYKSSYFLLFLFSSASFFSIERGQPDLIIYFLLFASLFSSKAFSGALVMLASIFKIFPIFIFSKVLISKSKIWIFYLAITILLITNNSNSILLLQNNIFSTYRMSFGFKTFYLLFLDQNFLASIIIFLLSVFVIKKYYSKTLIENLDFSIFDTKEKHMFLMGASVYCGLFVTTSSFDYKLIFLIFCFPLLLKLKTLNSNSILLFILIISNYGYLINVLGQIGLIINTFGKLYVFLFLMQILLDLFIYENNSSNHLNS